MTTAAKKVTRNYREREHRMSKMPIKDLLRTRMDELNIKNIDLQQALGYPQSNVIAMMKMGTMRMPANKAIEAARVLQLDPTFLMGKLLDENDPQLWDTIQKVMGTQLISENEMALVNFVRSELEGVEVNLTKIPNFVEAITPVLDDVKGKAVTEMKRHIKEMDDAAAATAAATAAKRLSLVEQPK